MPRPKRFKLATWHKSFPQVTVTPGLVDSAAQIAFNWGHCHALARVLHDVTRWPMFAAFDQPMFDPVHVAVLRPDGRILDIDGIRLPDYDYENCGPVVWREVEPDAWINWDYMDITDGLAAARTLVDPLLEITT